MRVITVVSTPIVCADAANVRQYSGSSEHQSSQPHNLDIFGWLCMVVEGNSHQVYTYILGQTTSCPYFE